MKALSHQPAAVAANDGLARRFIVVVALMLVLLVFFRGPLGSGLRLFYGDSYDGLIEIALLEHWHGVVARGDVWNVTGYFYPYADTLGYNDTNLVPGIPYTLARLLGGDPFVSALLAHGAMKALGFAGMYVLLRRGVVIRFWLAIAGAALFATANASLLHMNHAQLLSVGLLPWLMLAVIRVEQALIEGERAALWRWGAALALGYGVTAFTAFYAAWFFGFFALIALPVGLGVMPSDRRRRLAAGTRQAFVPLAVIGVLAIVTLLPLTVVYLPKVAAGARHSFEHGSAMSLLGATGLINVGRDNLVWGGLLDHAARALSGRPLRPGEARFGFPLGLLVLTALAIGWNVGQRRRQPLAATLGIALLVSLVLMARWPGGFTLWRYVFAVLPGTDAVRVLSRALLFALVPIVMVVFVFLDRIGWRTPILAALVVFLLLEQVQLGAPLAIDRRREMAMLKAVGAPPVICQAFAVVSARSSGFRATAEAKAIATTWNNEPPQMLRDGYRHNVDAMLIATYYGRPTINGFSTFNPPDAAFFAPDAPDYLQRVAGYARAHDLSALCLLDARRAPAWRLFRPTAPAPGS